MAELFAALSGCRAVSVIGLCKNAGKTTAFNRIIREYQDRTLGLTSIGRDGESTDLVTGTSKPGIFVREGTIIATARGLLRYCGITREILENTGISTPLGEVIIVRALSDGGVQLAGPSVVAQLAAIKERFFALGADMALVDGAISRKTLCSRELCDAVVLCAGASCGGSIDKVVGETAHFGGLLSLPAIQDGRLDAAIAQNAGAGVILLGESVVVPDEGASLVDALRGSAGTKTAFFSGAVSDRRLTPLARSGADFRGLTIAARDASKFLLSAQTLEKLRLRGIGLAVVETVELAAVTVNPFSAYGAHFNGEDFLAAMRSAVDVPVVDVLADKLY